MSEKKLVTFNLDEDRKEVWEEEAEDRGRSLSGFIRHCGEKEIANDGQSQSAGVDHTEELTELYNMVRGLMGQADAIDETVNKVHQEISIPDDTKAKIPEVVRVLPVQQDRSRPESEQEGLTTEEIGERTGLSLLKVTQCLQHAEEQTGIVSHHGVEEDGTRRFYRRV
jgi:hypothetical protein